MGNQIFMQDLNENDVGAFDTACYYMPFTFIAIAQSA